LISVLLIVARSNNVVLLTENCGIASFESATKPVAEQQFG